MRFSFYRTNDPTYSHEAFPTTTTTRGGRLSPVEIPELLEIVFSYVDNYTLRMSVVGVCRQWFLMNRHHVVREIIWDNRAMSKQQELIISRLEGAGRLWWYSMRHMTMMDRMGSERWDALVKALKKNFERDLYFQQQLLLQHQQQNPAIFLQSVMKSRPLMYSSLRDLELIDHFQIASRLNEILPYLSTLTRLRLQLFDYGRIHLDKVFEACPLLEVFEVDPRNYADFPSPWVPREKSQPQQHATRDNLSPSLPHNPQSLALRSFILRNGQFAQSDLESLLAQTPHLQVLKLVSLRSGPGFEEDKVDLTDISNSTKTCLEYHGIVLRSFHYSLAYTSRVWSQCAMFHVSPNSTDWTFSAHDLLPVMIDRLRDTPNVVTRLEIYHQDRAKLLPDSGLHRYLCESPHLLHLKAPYAAYLLEHLDIYCRANISRRQDIYNDTLEQQPSKVWACRNLQTLHLGFHIQRGSSLENKMQSRIIYGYLSAVCPKIHDLRIDPYYQTLLLPIPILFMDLDAGLCLLSRLQYLETLMIGSAGMLTTSGRRHLSWMVASGWTSEARRERELNMLDWPDLLEQEAQLYSTSPPRNILEGPYVDSDLIKSLQYLGLLTDVKNTLDRMGEDIDQGKHCWPILQRLSINRPIELGRTPEAELRRLYPYYT